MTPQDLQNCIKSCWECRHTCQVALFGYCLPQGGKHTETDHVKIMTDCIQICQTAADFMTRESPNHAEICAACAVICEACANSCLAAGMDECARSCRACAESCKSMGRFKKAA